MRTCSSFGQWQNPDYSSCSNGLCVLFLNECGLTFVQIRRTSVICTPAM
jgi:hypothetical protein